MMKMQYLWSPQLRLSMEGVGEFVEVMATTTTKRRRRRSSSPSPGRRRRSPSWREFQTWRSRAAQSSWSARAGENGTRVRLGHSRRSVDGGSFSTKDSFGREQQCLTFLSAHCHWATEQPEFYSFGELTQINSWNILSWWINSKSHIWGRKESIHQLVYFKYFFAFKVEESQKFWNGSFTTFRGVSNPECRHLLKIIVDDSIYYVHMIFWTSAIWH